MSTIEDFQATPCPNHPKKVITSKQRQLLRVKLCIIAFVSAITVVLTCVDVAGTVKIYEQKQKLKSSIQKSIDTASLIHNLQKERGLTVLAWGLKTWNSKDHVELQKVRKDTDESVLVLKTDNGRADLNSTNVWNLSAFTKNLNNFRAKIDKQDEHKLSAIDQLHTYSVWINELIEWLPRYTAYKNLENYANLVFAYQMIIQSKEEVGMERSLGGLHYIKGSNFSHSSSILYHETRIQAKNTISIAFSFSDEVRSAYHSLLGENNAKMWMNQLEAKRQILAFGNISKPSIANALEWFDLMTLYNDLMLELQLRYGRRIQDQVNNKIKETISSLVIRSILLCFTLVVVPAIIISLVNVQNEFYKYTNSLFNKVGLEQGRTEFLMRENARHVDSK